MSAVRKENDSLSAIVKVVAVVVVVCLGLWGCARKPNQPAAANDRVHVLESRCQKREQDCRAMAAARDKARKELAAMEEEVVRLQKEAADRAALAKECQNLRQQLKTGAAAREQMQKQLAVLATER